MDPKETVIAMCLADMAQATAWLNFTTAQANHDLQRHGEWRCDYAMQASSFQGDFDKAGRELMKHSATK